MSQKPDPTEALAEALDAMEREMRAADTPEAAAERARREAKRAETEAQIAERRAAAPGPPALPAVPTDLDILPAESTITAILGPTNTGKTHYAIERMLSYRTGVIGLPLRLLAREVYDKIVAMRGPSVVALITGEEKIAPSRAQFFVCTVEAMPLDGMADFLAVDEIQLCADPDRGHVFTDRLLHARGRHETLFMGSDVARPRIASLVPKARFLSRARFSTLSYGGAKKLSRLKPRTAVVAFSADQVYAIAELIRRQRGGAAVVMGALSPRTRNAQVALYQNGDVDYLVATDAIGMGLNLDVDHIAFAGISKFDGHRHRHLQPNEIGQIAGRAGRYTKDGSFGVTGEVSPFDEDLVEAIENHRFKPLQRLMWRNSRLDFGTVPMLLQSLEAAPDSPDLSRAREASDLAALRRLWDDPEIADLARHPKSVKLLWQVCQIPDFRKVMTGDHVALLGRIYRFLASGEGVIPPDWIAQQVARLDRTDGDIDALSKRLAYIRTWTYVANRAGWLDDPVEWRQATRVVEDKLSDALHERLTQRFVDRRTSVLMRRLKQKERLVAEVDENGGVTVEGEFVGRLSGFRFTADESATGAELKVLQSASLSALQAEFARRADRLYLSPDGEIALTEQGGLMWGTDAIGAVEKGDAVLSPKVRVFVDDIAEPLVVEKVERRLSHWLDRRIKALFEPMLAMQADEAVTGLARGVAFQLVEAMGIIPRREIADDIKALGQDERALLRKHGVRFGQHHIFMPALLKPAPTRLRIVLWGLWEGLSEVPPPPPAGHVTVPVGADSPGALFFTKAGYRHAGKRAVRIDMLERLADMLRPLDARAGFEATPDMLSITGCTLEQFSELMQGLGFEAERGERPKAARPAPKPETSPAEAPEAETPEASETETTLVTDEAPSAEGAAGDAPVADAPAPAETAAAAEATATVETTAEATTPSEKTSVDEAVVAAPVETTTEPLSDPADGTTDETTEATASAMSDEAAAEASPGDTVPSKTTPDAAPSEEAAQASEEEAGSTTQDTGAEPAAQETEVFYTFRTRPRGRGGQRPRRDQAGAGERQGGERRGGGGRRGAGGGSGGETGAADGANASKAGGGSGRRRARGGEGDEGQQRRNRDGQPGGKQGSQGRQAEGRGNQGQNDGQKRGKGPKPERGKGGPKGGGEREPRREKPIDPDSPFAILQQLKNK